MFFGFLQGLHLKTLCLRNDAGYLFLLRSTLKLLSLYTRHFMVWHIATLLIYAFTHTKSHQGKTRRRDKLPLANRLFQVTVKRKRIFLLLHMLVLIYRIQLLWILLSVLLHFAKRLKTYLSQATSAFEVN